MSVVKGGEMGLHYSYLLRMWQVPGNGEPAWRIVLENVQTGEKSGFASLGELLTYLAQASTLKAKSVEEG